MTAPDPRVWCPACERFHCAHLSRQKLQPAELRMDYAGQAWLNQAWGCPECGGEWFTRRRRDA